MYSDDPHASLGIRLAAIARLWRQAADRTLRGHGISEAASWPLRLLAHHGDGIRQTTLAATAGLEGPSLVRLLDHLENSGLIRREDDATDRRAKRLILTDAGRERVREIERTLAALRSHVLAGANNADIAAMQRVFSHMELALDPDRQRPEKG